MTLGRHDVPGAPQASPGNTGLLVAVGTGIKAVGHMTLDARAWIASADEVHYVTTDPITEQLILSLAPTARSLARFYEVGRARHDTYEAMTQTLLAGARAGRTVCAAFYGHPGVFVWPSHDAIRRARAEGIRAIMEPGVSAEDCLFADLGLDPAVVGCAQYEATDFLVYRRRPDPSAALIVWQIGAVGDLAWNPGRTNADNVRVLVEELAQTYGLDHVVVVYEAACLPTCLPTILHLRLADLPLAPLTTASTLFVPPRERRAPDPAMIARLALDARKFGIAP